MIKKALIAAALVLASPALVFSQDIFWSFSDTSFQNSASVTQGDSVTAYIFSDGLYAFDALDLNFNSGTAGALLFTGGLGFNPSFSTVGGTRFDSSEVTIDPGDTGVNDNGKLFAVNVTQNGVNPTLFQLFDPGFDSSVGPNGALLLASVDFTAAEAGDQTLELSLGPQGVLLLPGLLTANFGTPASLEVTAVPEPTSTALLALGAIGLVVRRKRA